MFLVVKEKDHKVQQKQEKPTGVENKINQLSQVFIDKSQSEMSNFKQVIPDDFLQYGDMQLYFRGMLLPQSTQKAKLNKDGKKSSSTD